MGKRRKLNVKKHEQYEDQGFMEDNSVADEVSKEENVRDSNPEPHLEDISDRSYEQHEEQDQTQQETIRLGQFIQQSRESKGLTISHLSHITKISSRNLDFLENNNLNSLPDRVYVVGYIKNYAKALGLDQKVCLELLEYEYQQQMGAPTRETQQFKPDSKTPTRQSLPDKKIILLLVAALFFIFVLIAIFYSINQQSPKLSSDSASRESSFDDQSSVKPQALSSQTPLKSELNEVKDLATTDNPETPPANVDPKSKPEQVASQEAPPQKEKEKEEESAPEKKKELKTKVPKRNFYSMSLPLYEPIEDNSDELSLNKNFSKEVIARHNDQLQNVLIKATTGNSWLTYKIDKQPIKQRKLKPGNYTLLQGNEIRVAMGNIGAIQIYYNKKPVKIESKTGIKNIVFPQENSSKYKMPLFIYDEEKNSFMVAEDYIALMNESAE